MKWPYHRFLLNTGKSVGFVTTTRVTHATPAALYAHTPDRDWEGDADMADLPEECSEIVDISKQLIDENSDIRVSIKTRRDSDEIHGFLTLSPCKSVCNRDSLTINVKI